MACPCRIQVFHADAKHARQVCERMRDEVLRIEAKYSRYRDDSALSRINRSAGDERGVVVDDETAALLDYAAAAWRESDGKFDPTAGILRRVWNFRDRIVPAAEAVSALLPNIGWQRLHWQRPRLSLPLPGMELDFGGFGKEYAADSAAGIGLQAGIVSGIVDLGGDVRLLGPQPGGRPWRIGIRDPAQATRAIASLALERGAIATSGDYERSFEFRGQRYSHLLDPHDGWPVQGYASVSVLAGQCLIAGTATTTAVLKGIEDGRKWLESLGLPWLAVHPDGRIERGQAPVI